MKKFIKNNLKTILVACATAIICISGSVFATLQYQANSVSYTTAKNGNIKNVEEALNDLYNKKNNTIKSGEAFLINASKTMIMQHNYSSYGAYFNIANLDFDNIKKFTYSYELTTTNTAYQGLSLSSNNIDYLKINSSDSGICELNGASNVTFSWAVANENIGKFKILSYTKMDGTVINLN